MLNYYNLLITGGVFTGFFISLILILQARNGLSNRLLCFVVFSLSLYFLQYIILRSGLLLDFSYIFRTDCPIYYLISPCCYLYVRSILYQEDHFKKRDWLHSIPALLSLIELMFFYFSTLWNKQEISDIIVQNTGKIYYLGPGFLPAITHYISRLIQALIYIIYVWYMLFSFIKENINSLSKTRNWLLYFSLFITLIYIGNLCQFLTFYKYYDHSIGTLFINSISQVFILAGFLGLNIYLFNNYEMILKYSKPAYYNEDIAITPIRHNPDISTDFEVIDDISPRELTIKSELLEKYVLTIEEYLKTSNDFKKHRITLGELAEKLEIPSHHLSYVLNNHYNLRFSDFINSYRIEYIKERLKQDNWQQLTLEGIANEAGFSSRSTFFKAFKKHTGISPTLYIQLNISS